LTEDVLHLEVRDDGLGGADPDGNGLLGLHDRVTELGGTLELTSPAWGGTRVAAAIPIRAPEAPPAAGQPEAARIPIG
jgi:signal transduction histidine kinase